MSVKPVVKIKKLSHFRGVFPKYQTAGSSGFDVSACLQEVVTLEIGQRVLIPTGLALEVPLGYELQLRPRSGLALKSGITLLNSPGTIDSDYRGELQIILINLGQEPVAIRDGDRIAQLVLCPVIQTELEEVQKLTETPRGAGGFGSTGITQS